MATALTNLVHCTFISCQTKNIKPQLSLKSLLNLFKSSCGVFFTSLCTVFICDVCGKSDPLSPPVLRSSAPERPSVPMGCALCPRGHCRLLPAPAPPTDRGPAASRPGRPSEQCPPARCRELGRVLTRGRRAGRLRAAGGRGEAGAPAGTRLPCSAGTASRTAGTSATSAAARCPRRS